MKETVPLAFGVGAKVSVLSGFSVTAPLATATVPPGARACPSIAVIVSGSPSASRSLARTVTVAGVSSAVAKASAMATGASWTGVTIPLTVAVALPPCPSETV
ncbi:hypothetical protein OPKNFCMD_6878 [Methylobacterium crusticola]|uniref:Uncharacterized protein n=1 Tax=Methylobacterium crusticola TaxID=1697972 RepID=A0ABQ4RBL0_9HYPH|nr:hypothetical protein OPKNFCMD_6878 [Methylobacterium crusticola]